MSDDSSLTLTLAAGQDIFVFVDGQAGGMGFYQLTIGGTTEAGLCGDTNRQRRRWRGRLRRHRLCGRPGLREWLPDRGPWLLLPDRRGDGTTVGAGNDTSGTCGGGSAPEVALRYTAPFTGDYRFSTIGSAFDSVLYVRADSCDGSEQNCVDNTMSGNAAELDVHLLQGLDYTIFVDGASGAQGTTRCRWFQPPRSSPVTTASTTTWTARPTVTT